MSNQAKTDTAMRCCKQVADYSMRFPRFHQCSNPAKVKVNGEYFCATHEPKAVAARKAKSDGKFKKQMDLRVRSFDCLSACHGMKNPKAEIAKMRRAFALLEAHEAVAEAGNAMSYYSTAPNSGNSKEFITIEKSELELLLKALAKLAKLKDGLK